MKEIQLELDRFEDNAKAVCYDADGTEHVLPESWIPTNVKEGDEFKVIIQAID